MQITVWAHPRSSQKKLILKDGVYHAYVHSPPENGKANEEIILLVAKEFHVPKSSINIQGKQGRKKIIRWADKK